jgi:hypothetical protein
MIGPAGAPASGSEAEPSLVVLPLETEGVQGQIGLDAWDIAVDVITKARAKLHVSMTQQTEIHGLLLGPARERARDCAGKLACLKEIGSTLEVNILVAGKVAKDTVSLVALDVASGARLGGARSPQSMAGASLERKTRAAADALIQAIIRSRAKKDEAQAAARDDAGAGRSQDPNEAAPRSSTPAISESRTSESKTSELTPAESKGAGAPTEESRDTEPKAVETMVESKQTTATGLVRDQNKPPSSSTSTQAPTATEAAPSAITARPPAAAEPVTSTWWFWTTIAVAALGGALTAALLFGGTKGGPAVPSETGRIMGTY